MNVRNAVTPLTIGIISALIGLFILTGANAETGEPEQTSGHWPASQPIGGELGPVTDAMLKQSPSNNEEWLHFGGNYAGLRHSPVTSLNPESVKDLKAAWVFPTGVPGQLEANPILYDGVLYVTSAHNRIFALDPGTGEQLWRYDHPQPDNMLLCCGPANRGASIAGDTILMGTLDSRLVALDRRTGLVLWNTEIAPFTDGFSVTSAPLIVGDMAIVGMGGAEFGIRGFFDAYDVNTGERKWRTYTVPGAGEKETETWAGNSYETGGGSGWATGVYDPELDTIYVATGNPAPDWNGDLRKGDNLWTDSLLALDPATGNLKWYFQFTPHDVWDYDGNSELWIVNLEIGGETKKVIAQANRNGYLYIIERTTGEFLRATQFVDNLNWAIIDKQGRPIVNSKYTPAEPGEKPARICPGLGGGNQAAYAGAVDPQKNIAFVQVIESCSEMVKGSPIFIKGIPFFGGTFAFPDAEAGKAYGHLSAIDLASGGILWKHKEPFQAMTGSLHTAGGVVFTGNSEGHALALDAANGNVLWKFATGSGIRSHPIAYEHKGKTYVVIGSGGGGLVSVLVGEKPSLPKGSAFFAFTID